MHFHPALTAVLWTLADELAQVRFICWVHDLAADIERVTGRKPIAETIAASSIRVSV